MLRVNSLAAGSKTPAVQSALFHKPPLRPLSSSPFISSRTFTTLPPSIRLSQNPASLAPLQERNFQSRSFSTLSFPEQPSGFQKALNQLKEKSPPASIVEPESPTFESATDEFVQLWSMRIEKISTGCLSLDHWLSPNASQNEIDALFKAMYANPEKIRNVSFHGKMNEGTDEFLQRIFDFAHFKTGGKIRQFFVTRKSLRTFVPGGRKLENMGFYRQKLEHRSFNNQERSTFENCLINPRTCNFALKQLVLDPDSVGNLKK